MQADQVAVEVRVVTSGVCAQQGATMAHTGRGACSSALQQRMCAQSACCKHSHVLSRMHARTHTTPATRGIAL